MKITITVRLDSENKKLPERVFDFPYSLPNLMLRHLRTPLDTVVRTTDHMFALMRKALSDELASMVGAIRQASKDDDAPEAPEAPEVPEGP